MWMARFAALTGIAVAAMCSSGCERRAVGTPRATVAVSNTYLQAAVRDVLGAGEPLLPLAEPGACPGHFDLRPSQIQSLRNCRLLLRFDFQAALDRKLAAVQAEGLRIEAVTIPGGMCEPDSYLGACRQAATAMTRNGLIDRQSADLRLGEIGRRLENLSAAVQHQLAATRLPGCAVVCSHRQASFCEWLGLEVVAQFQGVDVASIDEVEQAIRHGTAAKVVIANLPEGRRLADALGQRLGIPVVVFGNFPDVEKHRGRFDELVKDNVARLIRAASQ